MKLSKIVCCLLLSTSTILLADTTNGVELGDIIITGDKIDKNLQDSVSSVQVFDESDFDNSENLKNMYNIFSQTSNVNVNGQGAFNIRGISTRGIAGNFIGPSTTNISIDGNSLSSISTRKGAISTWDMKQVEVLKGPQSTSQGRNSLAGAVVLKSNDPEFETNGVAQASYGTNNTSQLAIMQTGAISENLALRFSIDKRHTDGYLTNDNFRNDEYNEEDTTHLRGKLLYKLDDEGTVLLTLSKMNQDKKGYWQSNKNFKNDYNTDGYHNSDGYAHSLDINYPINNKWSFQSITSFADEELRLSRDLDGGSDDNQIYSNYRKNKTFDQELRFNYIGKNNNSVIGIYHGRGKGTENRLVENSTFNSLPIEAKIDYEEKYTNTAIFFNTDSYLNDKFTLLTGLRVDKDKRDSTSTTLVTRTADFGAANSTYDAILAGISNEADASNDTLNVLPKIGLAYKASENINIGILFSKGYRPGGMSTNPITGKSSEYDKEYTDNMELSFKSNWLEKRLIFNANVFYTKWKDQQVSEDGSSIPYDLNTVNAGKSSLKGIEIEIKGQVDNNLEMYSSLGYVEAKFDEYVNGTEDYKGNSFENTPKYTANLGANYRYNRYFIGGNISYQGSSYSDTANENKLKAYSLVDLKVGYEQNDWAVSLYSNNLFDKNYATSATHSSDIYELGEGRTVGITLNYYW